MITDAEREVFMGEASHKNNTELAEQYGVSKRTIRRWKLDCRLSIPQPSVQKYDDYLKIRADKAMIIGM